MPLLLILLIIPIIIIYVFFKALAGIIDESRHRAPRGGHQRAAQRLRRNQEVRHFSGTTFDRYGEIVDEQRTPGFNRHGEIEQ